MEVKRLEEKGLITIDHEQLEELHNVKVLLRAHGEPPATYEVAKRNNIEIIDATCPVVLALQRRIKKQYEGVGENGGEAQVVIFGKNGHAEHISPTAVFRSFDTICRQVANRMPNIAAFAMRHDVVIFVAGKKSSNGRVLFKECMRVNSRSHQVESPEEIDMAWFDGASTVGICGATSTPKWLMENCRDYILSH